MRYDDIEIGMNVGFSYRTHALGFGYITERKYLGVVIDKHHYEEEAWEGEDENGYDIYDARVMEQILVEKGTEKEWWAAEDLIPWEDNALSKRLSEKSKL